MSSVYNRLSVNFDTSKFGDSAIMVEGASNTLSLISSSTPEMPKWMVADLAAGSVNRTNYFQNRTVTYTDGMTSSTTSIKNNAILIGDFTLSGAANNLIIELGKFRSHTDNISGVLVVSDPSVPSYDTASMVGQMNMMLLTKAEETPQNTNPILGSFTSLFIQNELQANNTQILEYSTQFASSITTTTDPETGATVSTSSLSGAQLTQIANYLNSTTSLLNTRRTEDWSFFQRSMQVTKDSGFLQQFSSLGGTNSYLINNVLGTPSLVAKLKTT